MKRLIISVLLTASFIVSGTGTNEVSAYNEEIKTSERNIAVDAIIKRNREKQPLSYDGMFRGPEVTSEKVFRERLHEMSAEDSTHLTEDKIIAMLGTLYKTNFEREPKYKEVLLNWKNGDFSNLEEVHIASGKKLPLNLDEEGEFLHDLHKMTHQKIRAERKVGAIEVISESIDEMLERLKDIDVVNERFYKADLMKWKSGDFSESVELHNSVWNNIYDDISDSDDRANGLLSLEEEQEFNEENF